MTESKKSKTMYKTSTPFLLRGVGRQHNQYTPSTNKFLPKFTGGIHMRYVTQFLAILAGYIVADRIVKIIERKRLRQNS